MDRPGHRRSVDLRARRRHRFVPIARNHLNDGFLPDPAAVRTEEFVNDFPQDYEPPGASGIAVRVDGTPSRS